MPDGGAAERTCKSGCQRWKAARILCAPGTCWWMQTPLSHWFPSDKGVPLGPEWICEECGATWEPRPSRPGQCGACGNRTRVPQLDTSA